MGAIPRGEPECFQGGKYAVEYRAIQDAIISLFKDTEGLAK